MSDETTTRQRPDLPRLVAAIVVIIAFVALAALAIAASRSSLSFSLPASAHETATDAAVSEPLPGVPNLASFTTPAPAALPAATPYVPDVAAPAEVPTTDALLPPPPLPTTASGVPCPQLGLLAPDDVGGLQSLVALIPLFGPFSPEAFALMPAFQPGIDALGPLFPVFQKGLEAGAPLLNVVTPTVQQLSAAGFGVLGPLYAPYRPSVLDAEKQLAAQLLPIVHQLATAPGSECLVALEGVLASLVN